MTHSKKNFGIIVSGGPAPGINCVISSVVIEANNQGFQVKGFRNGFRGASVGEANSIVNLTTDDVSRIYNTGGSILGTSRFNPFLKDETSKTFISAIEQHNIDKLVVIGGEGSAFLSHQLSKVAAKLRVVHVPKTIDNDLILPNQYPSFGFETARSVGTEIINTLMVDAMTTQRWFLVTSMGRKAGFLALGLGIASGATLTLIPEEFLNVLKTPEEIASVIFSSIKRRADSGKEYGVAIVAEGVLGCIDPDSSPALMMCPRDSIGRLHYSQIELGDVILPALRELSKKADLDLRISTKNIGYELRCHEPVSFDIEYTRFLGFAAVKLLLEGKSDIMVTRDFDNISSQPLSQLVKSDGQIKSRQVDLASDLYTVARSFMLR